MIKYLLVFSLCFSFSVLAKTKCMLIVEEDRVLYQAGECEVRHAPNSTFKIAISLMGFDEGILVDETHPELPYQTGYVDWVETWKQPHNPRNWLQNSCVWYSWFVTKHLGIEKLASYLKAFNYGNQDLSGDVGKNNGITHAWLSSSLEISPSEQVVFLKKLISNQLPISQHAQTQTKEILWVETLPNSWSLYGKTGSGNVLSTDRTEKLDLQTGWFVGWLQKDDRKIVFAHYIEDETPQSSYAGPRAKSIAREQLIQLIS